MTVGPAPNLVCALSGVVPADPVISPQGYIFEKKMILSYIDTTGKEIKLDVGEEDDPELH
jgi:hypothetical protein